MKKFHFVADVIFDAKDLDDAFSKLSKHFKDLENSSESNFEHVGELKINLKEV
jgi:hypothetical protein